jgi:hypothetical protein
MKRKRDSYNGEYHPDVPDVIPAHAMHAISGLMNACRACKKEYSMEYLFVLSCYCCLCKSCILVGDSFESEWKCPACDKRMPEVSGLSLRTLMPLPVKQYGGFTQHTNQALQNLDMFLSQLKEKQK